MLGSTIDGKYQIVRLLGQGGMGAVYEAAHLGTGRRVALKVILGELGISRDAILRFQREARAAGVIESQHIVQVLDTGIDREHGVPFMVMEYLTGEDLQKLCERLGPLPPDLALRITAQACSGLHKAHQAHVVHRDIKPANIYLAHRDDGDVVVRLLDFGIAKVKEDQLNGSPDQGLTRTGNMLGSPLYMSPEQAQGLKSVDQRTDVWSLGAVLYEALSGKTPHHRAETLGQLIMAICSSPPAPIQQLAPSVPPPIAEIVHRALRLDPDERFQSAAEMRDAIRRLLPHGSNLTDAMLTPRTDEAKRSIADAYAHTAKEEARPAPSLAPQVPDKSGAIASITADPFTRTTNKPSGSKVPLFGALAAVAVLGAGGLLLTQRASSEAAASSASAPMAAAPPPPAPVEPAPAPPVTASATASAAPSALVEGSTPAAPAPSIKPVARQVAPQKPARPAAVAAAAAAAPASPPAAAPTAAPNPALAKPTGLTVDKKFE
ncbi:MAG TPA: serine/threonine-protein kinase [Polyangiaceae bacterium]|nr:serine/threonine-protein kinase [Polyangiaceae bacterium]